MEKHKSPLKTIKLFCIDCSGDNRIEAKNCNIPDCLLYPFRLGKNPFSKRAGIKPKCGFRKKEVSK